MTEALPSTDASARPADEAPLQAPAEAVEPSENIGVESTEKIEPAPTKPLIEAGPVSRPRSITPRTWGAILFVVVAVGLTLLGLVKLTATPRVDVSIAATNAGGDAASQTAVVLTPPVEAGVPAGATDDAGARPPHLFRVRDLAGDTHEIVVATMGKRTFGVAMARAGISFHDIARLIKCFEGTRKFDKTNPHDEVRFARDRAGGKLVAFEYEGSGNDVWQAHEVNGDLTCSKLVLQVTVVRKTVGVMLGEGDLRTTLVAAGLEPELFAMLDTALDGHVEAAQMHAGAQLRIALQEEQVNGAFSRYLALDAVEYRPVGSKRAPLRVYGFVQSMPHQKGSGNAKKSVTYYDAKGQKVFHGAFSMPIPFARITSRFNPKRMHPVLHTIMPHNGVDFAGSTGTSVYAVAAGVVKFAADSGPCGNMVQIEHEGSLITSYCHLSRFAPNLKVGQKIERKQLLGYVGQTGRVTGPHLHFAAKRHDKFIDPLTLKLGGTVRLSKSEQVKFDEQKRVLDTILETIALPGAAHEAASDSDAAPPDSVEYGDGELPP